MSILFGDFETRSFADLTEVGLWNYSHHPSTEAYMLGYAFDEEDPELWVWGQPLPERVAEHVAEGGEFVAHNAAFELAIWNDVMRDWPRLRPEQVVCTMARCYAMALPGALGNAAPALGMDIEKDKTGHTLMRRMCAPTNKQQVAKGEKPIWILDRPHFTFLGEKVTPKWAFNRLGEYCKTDVAVERGIYKRTRALTAPERELWVADYEMNHRGVLFDPEAVAGAVVIKDDAIKTLDARMTVLTGGEVQACTAIPALKDFVADYGVVADSLAKEALNELLLDDTLPKAVRLVLETRQEAGRQTSVAKLNKASKLADELGRIHWMLQFHGAGTGRWAGRGLQPHNFPRDLPKGERVKFLMGLIRTADYEFMAMVEDRPLSAISRLLRAFIRAAPGERLVGGDWSNVEGRGVAWLAGEDWKVEAFRECDRNPDLPDMYERAYASSFNVDPLAVTSDQRQIGKVQELAFGYQGFVGAFQSMAKSYGVKVSDEKAASYSVAWRSANPMIEQYWHTIGNAAIRAVRRPGTVTSTADPDCKPSAQRFDGLPTPPRDRAIKFRKVGSFLWCLLPSQRALCYPYPQMREGKFGPHLTYMTTPSQEDWKQGRVLPDNNSRYWARVGTYGGKLTENVTQAICRDFLAACILELRRLGYKVVLHIHDEVIVEGRLTEEDRKVIERVMCTPPPWAEDFPLAADCWINEVYQK